MENLYLDLSEGVIISETRRKIYAIFGVIFILIGLFALISEYFDAGKKVIYYIAPSGLVINGLIFLFQTNQRKFKFSKCYISISNSLIEYKLWGLGKIKKLEWDKINNIMISKSNITFRLHDESETNLKINLLSNDSCNKIIYSVKGFSKQKQIDCKMI